LNGLKSTVRNSVKESVPNIMYDLIIKNGAVIDGTGSPAYHCDVAVSDGKIVRMERNSTDESRVTIDAKGLTVTPGFIDSHSHSDNAVFDYPDMIEKIEQGITTSIGGQCGMTLAPIYKGITDENAADVKGFGKENEIFKTFGTMAKAAKTVPLGSNLMSFVGHSALRKAVIGYENRKTTPEELEQMKDLLREAMENGAVGLSFGLIYTPSCYGDTDELIELARVVKEYEGVISAHIRNEAFELTKSVEEFLTVIKAVDVKAVFSHHKAMHKENWGKVNNTLKMIEDAVKEGYDIYCDVYPYEASSTELVPTIIAKELRDVDSDGIVKLVSDPEMRKKIRQIYSDRQGDNLNNLLVTACSAYPEYEGLSIDEIARLRNQSHFDAALDIIRDCGGVVDICNFSMCEEDIERVIGYERSMICTDSSVAKDGNSYHPRLRGSFPRVLGRYVRERKVVSLQEMIRKCTSMPASVYGLPTKGILHEGFDADICIFDAETIIDKADYLNCHERCEGLKYVILDGEIVVEDAIYNGKKMGVFIPRRK